MGKHKYLFIGVLTASALTLAVYQHTHGPEYKDKKIVEDTVKKSIDSVNDNPRYQLSKTELDILKSKKIISAEQAKTLAQFIKN